MSGSPSEGPDGSPGRPESSEVQAYLRRLITSIVVGVVLMTLTVLWAYHRYGARLADRPPLPSDLPRPLPAAR